MRRLTPALLAFLSAAAATAAGAPARAADMPTPAPSYTPPAVYRPAMYDFTGIYGGFHVGAGIANDTFTAQSTVLETSGTQTTVNPYAVIFGGQFGVNYQFTPWVVGIEGTYTASDISGSGIAPTLLTNAFGVTQRSTAAPKWFATATARVGYALNDLLFYAKGGAAWMQADYTQDILQPNTQSILQSGLGSVNSTQTITDTRTGFVVGAGVEYGMTENLSAKIEYDFLDFGTTTYNFNNLSATLFGASVPLGSIPISEQSYVHMFTVGLNYRFTWSGR
jgi:outer membrane immunogenic protein